MTDRDYDTIKRTAYDAASDFFGDAHSATLQDADRDIFPGVFGEMLDAYPQYEAEDLSEVVHWGIDDAWYDVLRDGYGYHYYD